MSAWDSYAVKPPPVMCRRLDLPMCQARAVLDAIASGHLLLFATAEGVWALESHDCTFGPCRPMRVSLHARFLWAERFSARGFLQVLPIIGHPRPVRTSRRIPITTGRVDQEGSMAVRAKFRVVATARYPTAGEFQYAQVSMRPVYGDAPENKSWAKATPSGEINMTITNEEAVAKFVEGKSYFVDFTPVD